MWLRGSGKSAHFQPRGRIRGSHPREEWGRLASLFIRREDTFIPLEREKCGLSTNQNAHILPYQGCASSLVQSKRSHSSLGRLLQSTRLTKGMRHSPLTSETPFERSPLSCSSFTRHAAADASHEPKLKCMYALRDVRESLSAGFGSCSSAPADHAMKPALTSLWRASFFYLGG